jgi:cAMP-dependent protein kinase regulator
MERSQVPAGTVLARQGEAAESLFVVLDGRLERTVTSSESDAAQALGTMGQGDVIGEVAVLTGTRRTATVRAEIASTVAALSATDLWRSAADDPELVERLLAASIRRLRRGQLATYLVSLLGPLASEVLDRIEPRGEWVTLRGGDVLFGPGDPGDALYVVLTGRLRVLGSSQDGHESSVDEMGRGQPIVMTSVLTARPRTETVVAIGDTDLARIDRDRPGQVEPRPCGADLGHRGQRGLRPVHRFSGSAARLASPQRANRAAYSIT